MSDPAHFLFPVPSFINILTPDFHLNNIGTMKNKETYTLITGGSGGLGKALAEECAGRGMNLILVALPDKDLTLTSEYIKNKYKVKVWIYGVDLVQRGALEKIHAFCEHNGLTVNMLINNAGARGHTLFEKSSIDYNELRIHLNVRALVLLTRLFIPSMKKLDSAYILNVGSIASFFSIPFKSVYSASKAFVLSFSKALRGELKHTSIKVSILCPNAFNTDIHSDLSIKTHGIKGKIVLVTPEKIAKTGIKKLLKGKKIIIPGSANKFLLWAGKILPETIKQRILYHEFKKELAVERERKE